MLNRFSFIGDARQFLRGELRADALVASRALLGIAVLLTI